jgi:GAF domain-containing protein
MRRASKASGKLANARRGKAEVSKHRTAHVARGSSSDGGQETKVARLTRELNEALERQTATAEVLRVISRSTFELQRVLHTLVESATRLCKATDAFIFLPDGELFRVGARYGFSTKLQEYLEQHPARLDRGSVVGRTALKRGPVHVPDVLADPEYARLDAQKISGYRAAIGVPLLRKGSVVGVFFLARTVPQPFTAKQIELVTTFADQAVIAIENVRLFEAEQQRTAELTESLEQQTATADVLRVISSSPGELEPVFQTMLENATRICEAKFATLYLRDADAFRVAAMHNTPPAYAEARQREPLVRPPLDSPLGRVSASKQVVHVTDLREVQSYIERNPFVVAGVGTRGLLQASRAV